MSFKIKYDQSVDAIYFRLIDSEILESEEISPGIVYDYDKDDNVVGVEVLSLKGRKPEEARAINFPFSEEDKVKFREFFVNAFA